MNGERAGVSGKNRARRMANTYCRSALYREATEKQDAQDHDDCNNDYLDQSHGEFPQLSRAKTVEPTDKSNARYSRRASVRVSN